MKQLISLFLITLFLSACGSDKTHHSTPSTQQGGGAGNGGGDENIGESDEILEGNNTDAISEEYAFANIPFIDTKEEKYTNAFHRRADFLSSWKTAITTPLSDIEFFRKPRLLYTTLHSTPRSIYFYLLVLPAQDGSSAQVSFVESEKAPHQLNEEDIFKFRKTLRPTILVTGSDGDSLFFWSNEKVRVSIVRDTQDLNTDLTLHTGPTASLMFKNYIKVTNISVLVRSETIDETLGKVTDNLKQDNLLNSSLIPDYKALSYSASFPIIKDLCINPLSHQEEFCGDISDLLKTD